MSGDEQTDLEAQRAAYWVRWHAEQRGLSLDKVAAFSGVGRTSVVEMGKRSPTLRTLACVAAFYGIQVRDLLKNMPDEE